MTITVNILVKRFQPTPSARRVTSKVSRQITLILQISTHTLRKEGDVLGRRTPSLVDIFQPTPSARRVTPFKLHLYQPVKISTHTLRKEGDVLLSVLTGLQKISTHTLRKEGDVRQLDAINKTARFQPTPSARRVTESGFSLDRKVADFNPHPPQGG